MAEMLHPLISVGLTSEEKLRVGSTELTPKQFLVSFFNSREKGREDAQGRAVALRTLVTGHTGKKPRRIICDLICGSMRSVGFPNATAFLTGIAGSIFIQLLAAGKIEQKGVVAPETAVSPDDFNSRLLSRGLAIRKSIVH